MSLTVYCSGSIPKGNRDRDDLVWGDTERDAVAAGAAPLAVHFLNPADPVSDLSATLPVFGRDLFQVQMADVVVVDARERRGIGVGVEMLATRLLGTKLVAVAPSDGYYRATSLTYRGATVTDYVHPHLASLCDAVVETFEEAGRWIAAHCEEPAQSDAAVLGSAIEAYKERLLPTDDPMLHLTRSGS